jgi:hypothetical protein
MRIAGIVTGCLMVLIGAVWTLQGLNSEFVPQSFMTGSGAWVVIGIVTATAGALVARWSWTRHR